MRSLSRQPLILIVDDDPDFQDFADWLFGRLGYEVRLAAHPSEIVHVMGGRLPDVVLLDWQLGAIDGTTLIEKLKRQFPLATIVFATGHSSPEVAAAAIKLGAFDFLVKPLDEAKLTVTLAKAVEHHDLLVRLHQLEEEVSGAETGFEGLIGISPQMRTIYSIIRNVSPTNVNVLVCGESGTGKELVASAIHARSDRSARPFVPLNMASIPSELSEATLFGHEKGAFTGADRDRLGAVGEAIGGTLFLDEITEMPLGLQGKLLRFLQERTYRPVGGRMDLKADVRIVSATNRDPLQAVRDKLLREDLYYRLNVVPIVLPPLREREGDVSLLAHHFLGRFSQQFRKSFTGVDREALQYLEAYPWPGNVRELVHTIQRIVVLNHGEKIGTHMLPIELLRGCGTQTVAASPCPEGIEPSQPIEAMHVSPSHVVGEPLLVMDDFPFTTCDSIMPMEELERRSITRAISLCGSAQLAAQRLGISPATMGCRVLNADGTVQLTCGQYPSLWNLVLLSSGLFRCRWPRFLGKYQMLDWDRNSERDVETITGCYMFCRAEVVRAVGLLDESFFCYGEETDWCRRFTDAGAVLRFAPVGEMTHYGSLSSRQCNHRRDLMLTDGLIRLHRKHGGVVAAVLAWIILASFQVTRWAYWCLVAVVKRGTAASQRRDHFGSVVRDFVSLWPVGRSFAR